MPGERCPHVSLAPSERCEKDGAAATWLLRLQFGSYSMKRFHFCHVYFNPLVSCMCPTICFVIQHQLLVNLTPSGQ